MVLIERKKCENVLEARKHERFLIETMNATLNKSIPSRTKSEYDRETRSILHECNCGGKYKIQHRAEHYKTKKHQLYLQNNQTPETPTEPPTDDEANSIVSSNSDH